MVGQDADVRLAEFALARENAVAEAAIAQQPAQVRLAHAVLFQEMPKQLYHGQIRIVDRVMLSFVFLYESRDGLELRSDRSLLSL